MVIRNQINYSQGFLLVDDYNVHPSKFIQRDRISSLDSKIYVGLKSLLPTSFSSFNNNHDEDNYSYNNIIIERIFRKERANNQIETGLNRIKQFLERKYANIKSLKKIIDFEINFISRENRKKIE